MPQNPIATRYLPRGTDNLFCELYCLSAQRFGSGFILNQDPDTDPDPIWIQGYDDQKLKKKNTAEIFLYFFRSNIAIN
jgi:hypothetical protein